MRTRLFSTSSTQSKWRGPKSSSRQGRNPSNQEKINQVTKHVEVPQVHARGCAESVQRQIPMVHTSACVWPERSSAFGWLERSSADGDSPSRMVRSGLSAGRGQTPWSAARPWSGGSSVFFWTTHDVGHHAHFHKKGMCAGGDGGRVRARARTHC